MLLYQERHTFVYSPPAADPDREELQAVHITAHTLQYAFHISTSKRLILKQNGFYQERKYKVR
jgi:hypothetical protein